MSSETRTIEVKTKVLSRNVVVDCTFPSGLISALVGPNGAGKSTILNLISGLLIPDEGSVTIGDEVLATPDHSLPPHRRPVALLDQKPRLFPHLNVLENVAFGPRARKIHKAKAREIALQELSAVGAEDLAHRPSTTLSGGQAQRVAVARALATHPEVVLLDEPFSALDVESAVMLRRVLSKRLRVEPRPTVVLVTHDPVDVSALADRIVAVEEGRIVGGGSVEQLLENPPTSFLANLFVEA